MDDAQKTPEQNRADAVELSGKAVAAGEKYDKLRHVVGFEIQKLPRGGRPVNESKKVLSFTYITPQGKFGRFEQLVDAKISKEDLAIAMDKKAKGGRIINAFLLPYAPKD